MKEEINVGYSRTVTVAPEQAELLNHLVDKYVVPVLERRQRIVQGALPRKELTPEEELEKILSFAVPHPEVEVPSQQQQPAKKIAQGGLNNRDLADLGKLLMFGTSNNKKIEG